MNARSQSFVALTKAQRARFEWLSSPPLEKVIAALEAAEEGAARFVGGCVRDSLLGETPKDFDVATTLAPEDVVKALKTAGLGAAPTGIDHGTVTAIADHQGIEVTTLRADVSTDGRRATVAFTQDWATDASRRDFRLNAIYLTPDGSLYDPVGGLEDIKARRVAFIGDAGARIREDYLRILRFFRFTARFSDGFDETGLAACAQLKDGIKQLSAERIGAEMMGVLSLPRAAMALEAMQDNGVLAEIWDAPAQVEAVRKLKTVAPNSSAPVALAALFSLGGDGIGAALRLSNAEKAIRSNALKGARDIAAGMGEEEIRVALYKLGRDIFHDAIAIAAASGAIDPNEYARMAAVSDAWTAPTFPISGRHILAAGARPGPRIAEILSAVEAQWIAEGFPETDRARDIVTEVLAAKGAI